MILSNILLKKITDKNNTGEYSVYSIFKNIIIKNNHHYFNNYFVTKKILLDKFYTDINNSILYMLTNISESYELRKQEYLNIIQVVNNDINNINNNINININVNINDINVVYVDIPRINFAFMYSEEKVYISERLIKICKILFNKYSYTQSLGPIMFFQTYYFKNENDDFLIKLFEYLFINYFDNIAEYALKLDWDLSKLDRKTTIDFDIKHMIFPTQTNFLIYSNQEMNFFSNEDYLKLLLFHCDILMLSNNREHYFKILKEQIINSVNSKIDMLKMMSTNDYFKYIRSILQII